MKNLIGLILAGGLSSRFGEDKTKLFIAGKSLLVKTAILLEQICDKVVFSGTGPFISPKWQAIPDLTERIGPIGGIYTGLKLFKKPLLAVACDLPNLNYAILEILLQGYANKPQHKMMTTFYHQKTNFIEPLVSIFEPQSLNLIESCINKEIYQIVRIFPKNLRHQIPITPEIKSAFFNINYQEDYAKIINNV